MQTCKVLSFNVRSITEQTKRGGIFSYLKAQKEDFYFRQETCSTVSNEAVWQSEWGGEIVFSHDNCHSRGACILIVPG